MDATYIVDGGVDATPQDADSTVVRVDDGSLVDDVSVPFGIEGSERSERERSFEEAEQFADAPFEDDELEVKEAVWEVEEIPPAPAMPELDDLAPKSGKDSTPESDPVLESATTDAVMPPEDEDTAEAEPRIEKVKPPTTSLLFSSPHNRRLHRTRPRRHSSATRSPCSFPATLCLFINRRTPYDSSCSSPYPDTTSSLLFPVQICGLYTAFPISRPRIEFFSNYAIA